MIGKTLGHYRVGEQLGRGGMGEVYLADDLSLNRKVALKFLPDTFAGDPERMARFEREAKLLASLNHPNIGVIYGLEEGETKRFLILELVEGETLAQRLSKGPLPLDEALGICRQIAEALEAAHEKGVIHRDLKPANVMIAAGDKVKILDFGLAKALSDETQSVDVSLSPTITAAMTRPGVVLGTAAYMSPEQAKGKSVDKRADIWAFGCILYECLAGKKAFEGETATETLAAVLTKEPEWDKVPAKVHPLLHRCLERDPTKRLRDIGDAMPLLEGLSESIPIKHARSWLAWSVAVLGIVAALVITFLHFSGKEPSHTKPIRCQIALPDKVSLTPGGNFALSPDGNRLAFEAIGLDGVKRLWIRPLDSLEARPILELEAQSTLASPSYFWSPDSRFIVFQDGGKLKKINVAGGPSQVICDLAGMALGGSWNGEGIIIFGDFGGSGSNGLLRVSASGGMVSQLTKPDATRQEMQHSHPIFLPDGRHFLYFRNSMTGANTGAYVGSLDSKPEEQSIRRILECTVAPIYLPSQDSGPGQILFLREQMLMAQPFDDKKLDLIGEPIAIAAKVGSIITTGYFSASTNGILAYRSGSGSVGSMEIVRPTWFDREGRFLFAQGEPGLYAQVSLSPDGGRAAVAQVSPQTNVTIDLWVFDFRRGNNTRFTFGQSVNMDPVWSPDGSRIIFASDRDGKVFNLYQKPANGVKNEELLLKSSEQKFPTSWSSDGRFLLYMSEFKMKNSDLWILPLEGDRKPRPFLQTEFFEGEGRFSPDMRWIAYSSNETGSVEIYVRPFLQSSEGAPPAMSGQWQISKGGGTNPRWRRDGKELYYLASDKKPMVVEIAAGTEFQAGTPKLLKGLPAALQLASIIKDPLWDVGPDGTRFLMIAPAMESSPSPFNVIINWPALLKK